MAAARFTDQPKRLACFYRKTHAVDGKHGAARALQQPLAKGEMLLEVANFEHGLRHGLPRKARASASRRPNDRGVFPRKRDIARGNGPRRARSAAQTRSRMGDC